MLLRIDKNKKVSEFMHGLRRLIFIVAHYAVQMTKIEYWVVSRKTSIEIAAPQLPLSSFVLSL